MSNREWIWVFHPGGGGGGGGGGGDLPHLAMPNTRDLLLLLFYPTVSLDFERCPISELTTLSLRMVNQPSLCTHTRLKRDVTVQMECKYAILSYMNHFEFMANNFHSSHQHIKGIYQYKFSHTASYSTTKQCHAKDS